MRTLCLSVPVGFAINWKKNIWTGLMGLPSFNSFGPFSASRRAASGEESPETVEPSWANMSSADRLCQALPFGCSTVEGVVVINGGFFRIVSLSADTTESLPYCIACVPMLAPDETMVI